jgi:hypothetical protein
MEFEAVEHENGFIVHEFNFSKDYPPNRCKVSVVANSEIEAKGKAYDLQLSHNQDVSPHPPYKQFRVRAIRGKFDSCVRNTDPGLR